jgi:electron transfer flavoprotein alpha/beta subunit
LDATAAVLAARVRTTGRKLIISASQCTGTDETSAQQLAALSGAPGLG